MSDLFDQIEKARASGNFDTPEKHWPDGNNAGDNRTPNPKETFTPSKSKLTSDIKYKPMIDNNACATKRKVIVKTIDLATAIAASTNPYSHDLGKEYKRIIGYFVINNSLGGLTAAQIKLGLSDASRTILDATGLEYHNATTAVPIRDRFNTMECIELINGTVNLSLVTTGTTTSALQLQVVYLVERD